MSRGRDGSALQVAVFNIFISYLVLGRSKVSSEPYRKWRLSDHYFLVIRMAQHGIYCTYIGLVVDGGDDGSTLRVAIFNIFISYFVFSFDLFWKKSRKLISSQFVRPSVPFQIFFFIFGIWLYMVMEQSPIVLEPYPMKIVTLAGVWRSRLGVSRGRDGSAPQVAIFISYFGFGQI